MSKPEKNGWLNLPNGLSFCALLGACAAILLLLRGFFYLSFALALVALVLDMFDGMLARGLGLESEFGRQLDSHVDVFIYLLYPALAFYLFLGMKSVLSMLCLFLFLAAGLFRLVRFTLRGFEVSQDTGARAYCGLPVYFTHLLLLALVCLKIYQAPGFSFLACAAVLAVSALMVSSIKVPKPVSVFSFAAVLLFSALVLGLLEFYGTHSI